MNTIESESLLIRSLDYEGLGLIQLVSEADIATKLSVASIDYLPKSFLESQWEVRDFELLMNLTGNLDAPL
jgi:hypothetical protein